MAHGIKVKAYLDTYLRLQRKTSAHYSLSILPYLVFTYPSQHTDFILEQLHEPVSAHAKLSAAFAVFHRVLMYQVMDNTVRWMHRVEGQQVYRARFSAITAPEIRAAMVGTP